MNAEEIKSFEQELKGGAVKKNLIIKFSCTDRLNETKNLEVNLALPDTNNKIFNEMLIDKLNEFQVESNDLMTEFVTKEKAAIASNLLSIQILKYISNTALWYLNFLKGNAVVDKKNKSEDSESENCEEEDDESDNDGETINYKNSNKKNNKSKSKNPMKSEEPCEKKKCL